MHSDAPAVLGSGMALVSYLVQRTAYGTWRRQNLRAKTSSWLIAGWTAVAYSLITLGVAIPLLLVALPATGAGS